MHDSSKSAGDLSSADLIKVAYFEEDGENSGHYMSVMPRGNGLLIFTVKLQVKAPSCIRQFNYKLCIFKLNTV